jgi:hypothetical protein
MVDGYVGWRPAFLFLALHFFIGESMAWHGIALRMAPSWSIYGFGRVYLEFGSDDAI